MQQDWATALLNHAGLPITRQNLAFLRGWQPFEGGHTNNNATFNWLNTTRGSQFPSINSVGVRAFPDMQTGLKYTWDTLNSGRYPDLVAGLAAGNPYSADVRDDLSVWVSGSPTGNLAYADKVLGHKGKQTRALSKSAAKHAAQLTQPQTSASNPALSRTMAIFNVMKRNAETAGQDTQGLENLMGFQLAQQQAQAQSQSTLQNASVRPQEPRRGAPSAQPRPTKGAVNLPAQWKGTHNTDGLTDHSRTTAIDMMASPGTPVVIPFDGVVERWGSAQGGEAMYLRAANGRRYWLGHVDTRIPVGTRFKAGSVIARISADHAAPHAHWDYL